MAVLLNKTVGKDKYWLTLNKTKDELASAPTFNKKEWPIRELEWKQSVDKFFGVHTVAMSEGEGAGMSSEHQRDGF